MLNTGDKIRYKGSTDDQVTWGNNDDPRGLLDIGQTYTVNLVELHSWHTKLELEGFPGKRFNSVCFEQERDNGQH